MLFLRGLLSDRSDLTDGSDTEENSGVTRDPLCEVYSPSGFFSNGKPKFRNNIQLFMSYSKTVKAYPVTSGMHTLQ